MNTFPSNSKNFGHTVPQTIITKERKENKEHTKKKHPIKKRKKKGKKERRKIT